MNNERAFFRTLYLLGTWLNKVDRLGIQSHCCAFQMNKLHTRQQTQWKSKQDKNENNHNGHIPQSNADSNNYWLSELDYNRILHENWLGNKALIKCLSTDDIWLSFRQKSSVYNSTMGTAR